MAKKSDFIAFNFVVPWLNDSTVDSLPDKGAIGRVTFNGKDTLTLPKDASSWIQEKFLKAPAAVVTYESSEGPVWIVSPFLKATKKSSLKADPLLDASAFAKVRDAAGQALQQAQRAGVVQLSITLPTKADDARAFLIGLEIAQYKFKPSADKWKIHLTNGDRKIVKEAEQIGYCVNIARHLVNLPPNELTPAKFAGIAKDLVAGTKGVKIEVWNKDRLKKENMNLLLAVGAAAANEPCLVHLQYRPGGKKSEAPIALVGKGITFDSGGLDIKTAAGMRLMKKDMGGAAAVLATFLWSASAKSEQPLDAYLSLAENAVGSQSFRPGDIYKSRNGQTIEISNTDAEGRLVLADALDVAVNQKGANEPSQIINVATLTGAIKVGLGTGLVGLFSNHHPLAEKLQTEFAKAGDPAWYMPLYQKYRPSMNSSVADMTNSVEAPFGGAITAALFLESFVQEKPWAHLDIYGWKDGADGAWSEGGGSGQAVLGLIQFLKNQ